MVSFHRAASPQALEDWEEFGGYDLESLLVCGAVALLDADWIVKLADKDGAIIQPRQQLPPEAFVSLDQLKAACVAHKSLCLPVVVLSYPWLEPTHPDSKGHTLRMLASVLKTMLQHAPAWFPRIGVFWDYPSLYQHPDPMNNILRSEKEEELFRQALSGLSTLYAHQYTIVLRATRHPSGYPSTYSLPEGANVASYADRGWCATESAFACLTKSVFLCWDLGLLSGTHLEQEYPYEAMRDECTLNGTRPAPLTPDAFAASMAGKGFTNGKDDRPLVIRLYADHFHHHFAKVTELMYSTLGWGDYHAEALAHILESNALSRLECLRLASNNIGDKGAIAIARALSAACPPKLQRIMLMDNKICQAGREALEAAVATLDEERRSMLTGIEYQQVEEEVAGPE